MFEKKSIDEEGYLRAKKVLALLVRDESVDLGDFINKQNTDQGLLNQVELLIVVGELIEQHGFSPRRVTKKIIAGVFHGIAFEENSDFKKYWSNILVSASNPEEPDHFHSYFVHLLKALSAASLPVLFLLYDNSFQSHSGELALMNNRLIKSQTGINQNALDLIYHQLKQLNLAEWLRPEATEHQPDPAQGMSLTRLGVAFLRVIRLS